MDIKKIRRIQASLDQALYSNNNEMLTFLLQQVPLAHLLSKKSISIARAEGKEALVIFLCTLAIHNDIEKNNSELILNIYQSITAKKITPYIFNLGNSSILCKTINLIINNELSFMDFEEKLFDNSDWIADCVELLIDYEKWLATAELMRAYCEMGNVSERQKYFFDLMKNRLKTAAESTLNEEHCINSNNKINFSPIFEIIVSGIHLEHYIERCIVSIVSQKCQKFRIHILSDDDREQRVYKFNIIKKLLNSNIELFIHCSEYKKGKAALIYDYFSDFEFNENSIAVILDGDDMFYTKSAIDKLFEIYQIELPDVAWSTYIRSDKILGHSAPLIKNIPHRQQGWRSSHCFTFKAELLKKVPRDYILNENGCAVMEACDIALALPILDLSQKNSFIPEVLYYYEASNPQSHHNQIDGSGLSSKRQTETARFLYSKKVLVLN